MSDTDQNQPLAHESPNDWVVYKRLLSYVKPYWGAFAMSILGFAVFSGASVGFAELMKHMVDAVNGADTDSRFWIPTVLVGLFFIRGVGSFLGNYCLAYVSNYVVHDLRTDLFNKFLSLSSPSFDQSASGHLVAKITFHVTQVTGAVTDAVRVLVREGFFVIGLLGYLFFVNWRLSLIILATAPMIAAIVGFAGKRFRGISSRIQDSMGDVTHVSSEVVGGYREVRIFGGINIEKTRFQRISNFTRQQMMKMEATMAISSPMIQFITAFAMGILVWFALSPGMIGDMTPGAFVAFISAAAMLPKPLKQLSDINAKLQRGLAAAIDIFQLLDEENEKDTGELSLDKAKGRIEFVDVEFSYNTGQPVFNGINLTIEPGQTVALVGRSGSGKSTLANLIPRFYEAQGGSILLDGQPIDSFKLADLRNQIALVSQQVTLFNDTVRNNIAYGNLGNASFEEITNAAKAANALDFIEQLPEGFETIVGDDGVMLSGGQRQRMAIARSLLKNAPILILDEATSALDTESEKYIQQALERVMENRTTLVIAHRLSTIEKADKIVVMEQGKIIEQGTHTQLLEKDGQYALLYRMQFSDEPVAASLSEEIPVDQPIGDQ
ncbi:MAG: lipid A export permease/ATP-binding protein MsbA [Pseudomonadales bacterium]|nr:lipid A export permease/ATP-binding protein MsbA [Pseudomonadales bacterium]